MSRDMQEVLRSIGVASSLENMERAIKAIRQKTAPMQVVAEITPPPDSGPSLKDETDLLESELTSLRQQLADFGDRIERYEQLADESLPQMMAIADAAITDYRTAADATRMYDSNWFSRLLLSQEAKQRFARQLLRLVRQYTKSNTDTLRMIADGDPEMMAIIAKPTDA